MPLKQRIIPVNIEDQMKSAYIDYSMSVIVSRALPDVRDGLKPAPARVLYGMSELGLTYNKAHKNLPVLSVKCWVNTIPMATPPSTTPWSA